MQIVWCGYLSILRIQKTAFAVIATGSLHSQMIIIIIKSLRNLFLKMLIGDNNEYHCVKYLRVLHHPQKSQLWGHCVGVQEIWQVGLAVNYTQKIEHNHRHGVIHVEYLRDDNDKQKEPVVVVLVVLLGEEVVQAFVHGEVEVLEEAGDEG